MFEVLEDGQCCIPVLDRGNTGEAWEQTDHISGGRSSTKHCIHVRANDRKISSAIGRVPQGVLEVEGSSSLEEDSLQGLHSCRSMRLRTESMYWVCLVRADRPRRSITSDLKTQDEL
jgi:hypothetical protein